jgi:D-alanyl-D-alanine carboxypeptidase
MLRGGAFGHRAVHWGALGLTAWIAVTAFTETADARRRARADAGESYQPAYASIVVDANSGAVMQATNADSPRHPASLTKIMTLYLLFERLEQGKIKLTTDLPVSAHAAVQAPSKLGLKPGESIRVETAIRAIVTKSANDVAVIVAEALGGDEANFAKMMTAKARALGMTQTVYRNASGLPEDQQITTARDQAVLGRAIQDRFPTYYTYFSTRTFEYRGASIRNHNHLLGAIEGVDGIKTGYIHESGFNIVTSVRRANRHILAVVFGGRSAEARDARVRSLIDNNINIAAVKRTTPLVVEGWETAQARKDTKEGRDDDRTGSAPVVRVASVESMASPASDSPAPGSTDPIKPNAVKTVTVHPATMYVASLSPLPSDNRQLTPAPAVSNPANITTIATVRSEPPLTPAASPAALAAAPPMSDTAPVAAPVVAAAPPVSPQPAAPPPGAKPGVLGTLPAKVASAANAVPAAAPVSSSDAAIKARGGWLIQVGAFDDEKDAKERLEAALGKAKDLLGRANSFIERVAKGDKSMFRARFAGLEKGQAEATCKHLKRSEIPCMLLKN